MEILRPGASVDRIVEATEDNYAGYLRGMAGLGAVTWCETPELTWFSSALPESWLNRIVRFSAPDGDVRSAVDSALDIFRGRRLPFQWSFGPAAHRIGLDRMLEERGGRSMGPSIGMAVDLGAVPDHAPRSELVIRPVDDLASATDWSDVLRSSFGVTPGSADLLRRVELNEMGSASGRMTFVGYVQDTPVSIGTLYLGGGVAGMLTIATIREARKRGFGKALTAYLLREARSLGHQVGVLMATGMGVGVYRDLGFRKTADFYRYEFPVVEPA